MITQKRLKELLEYDPLTGVFIWLKPPNNRRQPGDRAGNIMKSSSCKPYRRIGIDHKTYREHHLAWLYIYGKLPQEHIDHEDQDCQNNRISNLRLVSVNQNNQNKCLDKRSTSGITGVSWLESRKRWQAYICVNTQRIPLGRFKKKTDAIAARRQANVKYGFHPNHGSTPCKIKN